MTIGDNEARMLLAHLEYGPEGQRKAHFKAVVCDMSGQTVDGQLPCRALTEDEAPKDLNLYAGQVTDDMEQLVASIVMNYGNAWFRAKARYDEQLATKQDNPTPPSYAELFSRILSDLVEKPVELTVNMLAAMLTATARETGEDEQFQASYEEWTAAGGPVPDETLNQP